MKKVLILAYDFPPYISVGGLRPYSWYKYLKEYGIAPIVVTRQWNNKYSNGLDYIAASENTQTTIEKTEYGTIIKTPYFPNLANRVLLKYGYNKYKIFRKIVSGFYELFQWCFFIGPKVQLYFAARAYLKNNNVDVIIATGEPFILFRYASLLSHKYNIPWIADYRDPWTQNKSRSKNVILRFWNAYLEKKYLKNVNEIITVSQFLKLQIQKLITNKSINIIPNGFDDDIINQVSNIKQNRNVFTISFVGTIYKWHPIESFLNVFNAFILKNSIKNIELKFYGINIEEDLKTIIKNKYKDIKPFIKILPKIPNNILVKELAKSNVLLLFNDYPILGTKIYDYIATNRKILFCYRNDKEANILKDKYYNVKETKVSNNHLQEDIINTTNSGIIVENSEHLLSVLNNLYDEFTDKGLIENNTINIDKYSRRRQVEKLSQIIKAMEIK